jgi:cytochrome c556
MTARADTDSDTDLKKIMQDLQSDSALVVQGLLMDDFDTVADAAARIANHPRIPPEQVALIAAELGAQMPAFKQFDTLVHNLALSIGAAAQEGDSASIAANYSRMLHGCLACHASYKQRVSEVLNPD